MLPAYANIAEYAEKIDANRIYSNFGPLVSEFEKRLAARTGHGPENLLLVSNATSGIALTLSKTRRAEGHLCIMPSWTFCATAHAAILTGLTPYFVDVDRNTWVLSHEAVQQAIQNLGDAVAAIVVVSPFGSPVEMERWDQLSSFTGIPVIIDAAAGFDAVRPGKIPVIVSLHATKILATGEGGFIASDDTALIRILKSASNFGFRDGRVIRQTGTNAKMSEIQAAVGLAALDSWDETRAAFLKVARLYRHHLSGLSFDPFQAGFGKQWISTTCVLKLERSTADEIRAQLNDAAIDSRSWWNQGCHREPAFASFPAGDLSITSDLAAHTISVPIFRDLNVEGVEFICSKLTSLL
jgi:dTDP-4-amino-4,6-dideoxygalactose transaminase